MYKTKEIKIMSEKPYYIGLTVGSKYAAYAVTNDSYNLERFKGQDMWGTYKFSEAETSKDRTAARSARKNIKKEKKRIGLLRTYFYDEVMSVDKNFFIRQDNSTFFRKIKMQFLMAAEMFCLMMITTRIQIIINSFLQYII